MGFGFLLGGTLGERRVYNSFASDQFEALNSLLTSKPNVYSKVKAEKASSGYAYLDGYVANKETFQQLEDDVGDLFGRIMLHEITWRVTIW